MGFGLRKIRRGLAYLALGILPIMALSETSKSYTNSWERYQVILDKNPFKSLDNIPTGIIPDFAKSLRLSAIANVRGKLYAGFVIGNGQTNNFMLTPGELSEDGFFVSEIDYQNETVKIGKGSETATLTVQALPIQTNLFQLGSSTNNPWREFYQRYQERHANDRSQNLTQAYGQNPIAVQVSQDGNINRDSLRNLTDEQRQQIRTVVQEYQSRQSQQNIQNSNPNQDSRQSSDSYRGRSKNRSRISE